MNLFSFTFYPQNNFALTTRKYFYSLCAVLLSTLLLYNFFFVNKILLYIKTRLYQNIKLKALQQKMFLASIPECVYVLHVLQAISIKLSNKFLFTYFHFHFDLCFLFNNNIEFCSQFYLSENKFMCLLTLESSTNLAPSTETRAVALPNSCNTSIPETRL